MFALYDKDDAIAGAPGQFVTIDAAARKMFYTRTQTTCPACGRRPSKKTVAGNRVDLSGMRLSGAD